MRTGTFRDFLTFEDLVSELDSDGAQVQDWVDAFDTSTRMPAAVTPLSGRELIAAQAVQSRVTTRIVVRYRPGLTARMRARAPNGTIYNIEAIVPDAGSGIEFSTLLCSSGVDQGGTA